MHPPQGPVLRSITTVYLLDLGSGPRELCVRLRQFLPLEYRLSLCRLPPVLILCF